MSTLTGSRKDIPAGEAEGQCFADLARAPSPVTTIAGGTGTTDVLFRAAVGDPEQLNDLRLLEAVELTSAVPLRALGLGCRDLSVGTPADLVVLSPHLQVTEVMSRGKWVDDR